MIVDARGLRCPWPAIQLARAMRETANVIIVADDAAAPREIAALCTERGWNCDPAESPIGHGFRVIDPNQS